MNQRKPTVVVTGIAGDLGRRLLKQLDDFDVVGVDVAPPAEGTLARFEPIDFGQEAACQQLVQLLRSTGAHGVVHLAFAVDQDGDDELKARRRWQMNVAGTARVMEAITELHRIGRTVQKFVFPSSVSVYGSHLERPATEESRLMAHTLPFAVHKRECDEVVQLRAESLGYCSTYILRPNIYTGAAIQNYTVGVLRGIPGGTGRMARSWRRKGRRLPVVLPFGEQYLHNRFQFVHIDDMARLVSWILRQPESKPKLTILNVAGRGQPIELRRCVRIAQQQIMRFPGRWACRAALRFFWRMGISSVPPEALPYMTGSYLMDTTRLQAFLGKDYQAVIQYTIEDALRDSFSPQASETNYAIAK
jgi:nucleoside-diphosphate-sugar epimerase